MPIRATTRYLSLALIVGGALTAGCSSSPSATSSTDAGTTSVVAPGASIPFNPANDARADVSTRPCVQTTSGWVLTGSVKNPGPVGKRFQVVVDFVSRAGSTVLATTVLDVPEVAPGARLTWSATGAKGKADVACVVRFAQST